MSTASSQPLRENTKYMAGSMPKNVQFSRRPPNGEADIVPACARTCVCLRGLAAAPTYHGCPHAAPRLHTVELVQAGSSACIHFDGLFAHVVPANTGRTTPVRCVDPFAITRTGPAEPAGVQTHELGVPGTDSIQSAKLLEFDTVAESPMIRNALRPVMITSSQIGPLNLSAR